MAPYGRRGGCLSTLISLLISLVLIVLIWYVLVLYLPVARNLSVQVLGPVSQYLPSFIVDALYSTENAYHTTVLSVDQIDEDGLEYAALSDDDKMLYQQILDGLLSREQSFVVYDAHMESIENVYRAVLADHPEVFWVDGSTRFTYFEAGGPITIEPGLSVPLEEVESMSLQIEEVVQAFHSTLPADADEYTIAKMAYEYVINTTDYDLTASQNQNMQSALLGHASVCAGYARAYQYLLQRSGVFCSFVEGTIPSTGEDHAWNLVRLDGVWTYVDVTWGDPTYPGLESNEVGVVYDYLGLTTEELLRDDHQFSNEATWPVCDSTACSYYAREGLLFDAVSTSALSEALWSQKGAGVSPVAFKFSNEAAYLEAAGALTAGDFLIDDIRTILTQEGTLNAGYQYQTSSALYIIKLFL